MLLRPPSLCRHFSFFVFFKFFLFGATPIAYESSQARGQIRIAAAGWITAKVTQDLSHVCKLHHSSWQRWIPNPMSRAREQTCVLMILVGLATTEPQQELPTLFLLKHSPSSVLCLLKSYSLCISHHGGCLLCWAPLGSQFQLTPTHPSASAFYTCTSILAIILYSNGLCVSTGLRLIFCVILPST